MNKIHQPFPCGFVVGRIKTGAAGGNAAFGGNASHFGIDQPRATLGAFCVMDKMPIGRAAISGLVLRHGRDDYAVFQPHVAQLVRREHWCASGRATYLFLEPVFCTAQPVRVSQAQVFVADALAARQQGIGELRGGHIKVSFDLFKPFKAVARRRLQAQNLDPAFVLIAMKGLFQCRFGMQIFCQRNRAIEGEARP